MSPLFYTLSLIYPDFLFRILLIFSNNLWTTPYLMHVMTSTNFLRLQAVLWVRLSENLGSSANILNRSRPCIPIWGRVWRILVWLEMSVLKRKFLVFQSQQSPLLVWIQSVHQQTRKKKSRIIIRSSEKVHKVSFFSLGFRFSNFMLENLLDCWNKMENLKY